MDNDTLLKTDLSKRIYGLDILRAIAILFVLFFHCTEFMPPALRTWVILFAKYGVTIFFALSGYLIGGILIKNFSKPDFSFSRLVRFRCNRWLRTLPPYYFALLLITAVMYAFDLPSKPSHLSAGQMARFFVFLQNFNIPRLPFFPESWSLSVEEWFYLITPTILFVLYIFIKIGLKKSILATVIIIIGAVLCIRGYRFHIGVEYDEFQVVNRLDSLMFGVIAAYIAYYHQTFWTRGKFKMLAVGLFLLTLVLVNDKFFAYRFAGKEMGDILRSVIDGSLIPLVVLFILPFLASIKTGKGFIYKFVTYTSLVFYSLYLLHYTLVKHSIVGNIDKHLLSLGNVGHIVLIVGISYFLATLMYLWLEKPCMDVRKKIKFLRE